MTKYAELRLAFSRYKDAEHNFVFENEQLALSIVNGLREYLNMPNNYQIDENNNIIKKSYTPFYSVDEDDNVHEEQFYRDAISHSSDGSFSFAFGIILERVENSFPKYNLIVRVECKRKGGNVHIEIPGKSVEIPFDGSNFAGVNRAHEMIYFEVLEWLKHRPGDGHGISKIGFAMS